MSIIYSHLIKIILDQQNKRLKFHIKYIIKHELVNDLSYDFPRINSEIHSR